jgi:hypothetical protein
MKAIEAQEVVENSWRKYNSDEFQFDASFTAQRKSTFTLYVGLFAIAKNRQQKDALLSIYLLDRLLAERGEADVAFTVISQPDDLPFQESLNEEFLLIQALTGFHAEKTHIRYEVQKSLYVEECREEIATAWFLLFLNSFKKLLDDKARTLYIEIFTANRSIARTLLWVSNPVVEKEIQLIYEVCEPSSRKIEYAFNDIVKGLSGLEE